MASSSRRGSGRETWTTALEDFTPSASPSPSSSENEDEEYGEIGASRRTSTASSAGSVGSGGTGITRGLLSAKTIAHGGGSSARSDDKDATAEEPYAYGIPPSRRSSLLQQDHAEPSSSSEPASGRPYGLESSSAGQQQQRRQSSSSSLLDDEAVRTQRKVEREAKLRRMEEAVRIASGEARSLMYGDGGLLTPNDALAPNVHNAYNNAHHPHHAPESNAALLARGTREHLEEVKLTGGGNNGSGTKGKSHVQQGSVSDRLKHLLPAYWNPNDANVHDDRTKVAFPGSSLSTRSLTTPGRNLHDLAGAPSSSGDGNGSSGSQRQIKLANSGITLDFYDDYYPGSDDGISGSKKGGGTSPLLSNLRHRATTVTDNIFGGSRSHHNTGRRRLVVYVAAMAIVVGLAFHVSGGTTPTSTTTSTNAGTSNPNGAGSSSGLASTPSASSTFGVATSSTTTSGGDGHQHDTHGDGDNSHSISRPIPTEAASVVINAPDAPLRTPSSPSSTTIGLGSISTEIVDEPDASSRFNAMKRRLIEEGITTVGNVHPENSLTFGGGSTLSKLHTYPSMQRRALQWLADEDNRRMSVNHPYLNQRFALACLWFSTFDYSRKKDAYGSPTNAADLHADLNDEDNDANKPNWISTRNWMTPQPICSWHGVACDKEGDVDGVVVELSLIDNGIRGYVPGELKRGLGEDVEVDMSGNQVSILKDKDDWQ